MINFIGYIISGFAGFGLGSYVVAQKASVKIDNLKKQRDKNQRFYKFMSDWVLKEADGNEIITFLKERNYNNIAIYGMGVIGRILSEVLMKQGIHVLYVIDRRTLNIDLPVYNPLDRLPNTDVIINTAIMDKAEVVQTLKEHNNYEVISIDEII